MDEIKPEAEKDKEETAAPENTGAKAEARADTESRTAPGKSASWSDTLPKPQTARLSYCSISEMRPSPESKYAPMGVFGYIVMLFFTSLPVLGFIVAVITALASKKLARSRLAAASAILHAAVIFLLSVSYAVAELVFHVDVTGFIFSFFGR